MKGWHSLAVNKILYVIITYTLRSSVPPPPPSRWNTTVFLDYYSQAYSRLAYAHKEVICLIFIKRGAKFNNHFTYAILKGVVYNHTASVGDTDELLPHNLQALSHAWLTPQQVQEFPVGWLP